MTLNKFGGVSANDSLVAFNAVPGGSDYAIDADALSLVLSCPFTVGGYFPGYGQGQRVQALSPESLGFRVSRGAYLPSFPGMFQSKPAFVKSQYSDYTVTQSTNNRIDLVGILFTLSGTTPSAEIVTIQGADTSGTAARPTITDTYSQSSEEWFEELAEIRLDGSSNISSSSITDSRTALGISTDVGTQLPDSQISTQKLADSAITTTKFENKSVTLDKIASSAISAPKLVDSSVTTDKLSSSISLSITNFSMRTYSAYLTQSDTNTLVANLSTDDQVLVFFKFWNPSTNTRESILYSEKFGNIPTTAQVGLPRLKNPSISAANYVLRTGNSLQVFRVNVSDGSAVATSIMIFIFEA